MAARETCRRELLLAGGGYYLPVGTYLPVGASLLAMGPSSPLHRFVGFSPL